MKKSYLMIAAAALVFAACSNENIAKVEDPEVAIDFTQYINKTLKAEITNETTLNAAGGFKVWAYKAKTANPQTWTSTTDIFTGKVVTISEGSWSYTGTKYWDKTCTYKFFAGGPASGTTGSLSWADGVFSVSGAASALASSSTSDFVIDRAVNVENGQDHTTSPTTVDFDFHHIMAKVSFKVGKKSSITDEVVLTSLKMSGWNNNTGAFTQGKFDDTWDALNTSEWTISTSSTEGETAELASNNTLLATPASLTGKDYIMVPQDIAANTLKFTVSYTINDEAFTDQEVTLTSAQKWGTDSHTVYTLVVGPEAIEFDVASICNFCVDSAPDDINVK